MASGSKILQKKLEELESQLDNVVSFPPDTPCHHLLAYDIRQRFSFCNNLLSREKTIAHRPKPDKHLLRKLAALESAFRAWDAPPVNPVETGSKCSCTESCLNDDQECWTMGFEGSGGFPEGEAEREEGKKSSVLIRGGRCAVLALGVAFLNLVILTFPTVEDRQEFVLVPT